MCWMICISFLIMNILGGIPVNEFTHLQSLCHLHGGETIVMGVPQKHWMVSVMENPCING